MAELDSADAHFWRQHRERIVSESILTSHQNDYAPHTLRQMLGELSQADSKT